MPMVTPKISTEAEKKRMKERYLVMDVVVLRVVREEPLEWIERQSIPTMIIDRLQRRKREKSNRLADGHERH